MLAAHHLAKSFGERTIVDDVSLTLQRSEIVGLLGPNGTGKTTLFHLIAGLIFPARGQITLDDVDVTRMPLYQRARRGMSYLPQEPSIIRDLTVEQNIMLMLETQDIGPSIQRARLDGLLSEFGIASLRKVKAARLSGGERRRCEIARSLAGSPSFILLDEPFAGIDPIAIGEIKILIRHLARRGIGVLITDHNARELLDLVDRTYILHTGRVLTSGSAESVTSDPLVRSLYLGVDFRFEGQGRLGRRGDGHDS